MDTILETLETLIDDIERDENLTKDDIHSALSKLKTEIEDHQLSINEGGSFEWEDLD